MKNTCILCDFDGTITEKDGLYGFFVKYGAEGWHEIERLWASGEIDSKECLKREFESVPDLSAELIDNYLKTSKIDAHFKEFFDLIQKKCIDFYIVSDGADYFIEKTLENSGIKGVNIISNHFELNSSGFSMSFPNSNGACTKNAGTCKCSVLKNMKNKYKKVIYIGDGISDYCVSDKADILFAKSRLIKYCREKNIKCIEFSDFSSIAGYFKKY